MVMLVDELSSHDTPFGGADGAKVLVKYKSNTNSQTQTVKQQVYYTCFIGHHNLSGTDGAINADCDVVLSECLQISYHVRGFVMQ